MSQALMSASESDLPKPVLSASAGPASESASTRTSERLCVDMLDLPFAVDGPCGEAVVMLVGKLQRIRHRLSGLTASLYKFGTQRLGVSGLVPSATLQDRRLTIPAPRHGEARECLVVDRALQRGLGPGLAAISRYHDFGDPPGARIGDAGDGIEARFFQLVAEGGIGDETLHLHEEVEPPSLAARQDLRITPAFEHRVGGLIDGLEAAQELDVHVALIARQQQAHRIAVSRHQALAVLVNRNERVVVSLLHRHAATEEVCIGALGYHPFRLR